MMNNFNGTANTNDFSILNNQNSLQAEPIVMNQDVFVPKPVIVKKVIVPKPFLPYSKWSKNGFPRFW